MARLNVRVRPAQAMDVPALARLVNSVDSRAGTFSGVGLGEISDEHLAGRLAEILQQDDRRVLVAVCDDDEPIGMLATRNDDVGAINLTPVLHVTHLLVQSGQRRRGIGRALLSAAVHLAEDTGAEQIVATAAAGSREGNRYLARLGFAPLVVHRVASLTTLRRSLGMSDTAARLAVLRRARLLRAQRSGFGARSVGRGA